MGSLISSLCSKSRIQTLDKEEQAIIDCKICRDKIKTYIKKLEKQELLKKNQAKTELKNNNRDKAKRLLNQSKIFNEQIKVANGQLEMIMDQITQIESAQMKRGALQVLEQGNAILRKLNEEVNIEKWEKVSDDLSEMKQQQDEISYFLNNHRIDQNKFDDELNNELEELEKMQMQENNYNDKGVNMIDLPSVKNKTTIEDDGENKEVKQKMQLEI